MKSHLRIVAPTTEKRTVDAKGGRKPNSEYRTREHLTEAEVERLIEAAKANRWGHRDATMRRHYKNGRCRRIPDIPCWSKRAA